MIMMKERHFIYQLIVVLLWALFDLFTCWLAVVIWCSMLDDNDGSSGSLMKHF